MLAFKCLIVLLFAAITIKCETCVTYDFGENFYNSFNNDYPLCYEKAKWNLGNYSSIDVQSPHPDTELFITPDEVLSCVSSYEFEMTSSGTLETYVYMDSNSMLDQLVVIANEVSSAGKTVVTGMATLTPLSSDYVKGWQILRINLLGPTTFTGYVSFLGLASPDSTLIVDSFRYIPPLYDEDCHIYDGELVTTSPLQSPEPIETECVTYNFEIGYDELFNNDSGPCPGFNQWVLGNYTTLPIDNLSTESEQFIFPQTGISCVSSFEFEANTQGVIEVNVYMESAEASDQISVLVHQLIEDGNDAVTGFAVFTPLNSDYNDGWNVLRIVLSGPSTYNTYITFMGLASEESIVLIDSFRYIPPTLTSEDCKIYEDEIFEATTAVPDTTVAPIGTGKECITYNFESDFENSFNTNNVICNGYSSWHLGDYYSRAIEPVDPSSNSFIAPNKISSCVSSFIFKMSPGGTVEVNVYMKSNSSLDYIIILAKKVVTTGVDTVSGFELYHASDEKFREGWNVLNVSVYDFSIFNGYITLIGSTADDSLVLVDSFRYIPPSYTGPCDIY